MQETTGAHIQMQKNDEVLPVTSKTPLAKLKLAEET